VGLSFTGLDLGLSGGALNPTNARSEVRVQDGGLEVVRAEFAIPGFDGTLAHNFGGRGRSVTCSLALLVDGLPTLTQIEEDIEEAMKAGEGTLELSTGRSFSRAILAQWRPGPSWETIRQAGDLNGWITRDDVLIFRVFEG